MTQAAFSVQASTASVAVQPYARTARPAMRGSEAMGDVPGLRSVERTQIAPASAGVGQRAPGRGVAGLQDLGPGKQEGGARRAGERPDVLGWKARQVVDAAGARIDRDGDRSRRRELLDVGAEQQPVAAGQFT